MSRQDPEKCYWTWHGQSMSEKVNSARRYAGKKGICEKGSSLSELRIEDEMLEPEGALGLKPWMVATFLLAMYDCDDRRKHGRNDQHGQVS